MVLIRKESLDKLKLEGILRKDYLPIIKKMLWTLISIFVLTIFLGAPFIYKKITTTKPSFENQPLPQISGEKTIEQPKERKINPEKFYAPILLYHHIAKTESQNSYFVSPEIFDSQMEWLKNNGYHIISLDKLYRAAKEQDTLPDKPIVITFDDSLFDQYKNGFPILKKYGFPATFFVKLNNIGKGGLTYKMLREMAEAGMTIGSHSINHNNMAKMDPDISREELVGSKKILENNLGIEINFFSYPGGAYSEQTIVAVKEAGYLAAIGTKHKVYQEIKNEDSFYTLSRVHIDDEMPTFIDWIQGINLD